MGGAYLFIRVGYDRLLERSIGAIWAFFAILRTI